MAMIRKVKVRGVIVKDGKLFCVKHISHEGRVLEHWSTPGGGLDIGEPLISGLIREMIEETGVKPVIGNLLLIQQFVDSKNREQLVMFFHITNAEDYQNVNLSDTTHGVKEIHDFGFVDPKTTNILPKILKEMDINNIDKIKKPLIINEIPKGTATKPEY